MLSLSIQLFSSFLAGPQWYYTSQLASCMVEDEMADEIRKIATTVKKPIVANYYT